PSYDQKSYSVVCFFPFILSERSFLSHENGTCRRAYEFLFTNHYQAIKGLTDKLDKEVEKVAPRPRFQFKPRSKPAGAVKDDRRILGKPTVSDSSVSTPSTSSSQATPPPKKDYNTILRSPPYLVKRPSFSSVRNISLAS